MKTVDINLGARAYQVRIGRGLLSCADEILPWVSGRQACIVTDETVAKRYLAPLRAALAGKQVTECVLPGGEPGKTLDGVSRIFEALLRAQCEREVSVVALGGGVVGDMAGFAAACYQRGAPFIQAPTTLLSQVDSSVGGKTGVNHALGKNMIGAFHQPRRVLADTATLDTLDRRQFAAGMATPSFFSGWKSISARCWRARPTNWNSSSRAPARTRRKSSSKTNAKATVAAGAHC